MLRWSHPLASHRSLGSPCDAWHPKDNPRILESLGSIFQKSKISENHTFFYRLNPTIWSLKMMDYLTKQYGQSPTFHPSNSHSHTFDQFLRNRAVKAKPSQAMPRQAMPRQAMCHATPRHATPSQAKPSQAKPSQANSGQVKSGQIKYLSNGEWQVKSSREATRAFRP